MNKIDFDKERYITVDFDNELSENYLKYSKFVVLGRSIPQIVDGCKPVTRRALYTLHNLNLYDKYVKSSKAVGDLGSNYHPYGDASGYQTIVNMATVFNLRMKYIDGYGNFGGAHYDTTDTAGAQRYTSVKLSEYSKILLSDLKYGVYNVKLNYDSTRYEPILLPVTLPNLLINGTEGIGVGFATDIPSHCPKEIINACIAVLKNPEANVFDYILGPDFITGGIILNSEHFQEVARGEAGKSLYLIGTYVITDKLISITSLPHGVAKNVFMSEIVEKVKNGELTNILDLQDYSDYQGMHIEITYSGDGNVVVNQLIQKTSFRTSVKYNPIVIDNGTPVKTTIPEMVNNFLSFRAGSVESKIKKIIDTNYSSLRNYMIELSIQHNSDKIINLLKTSDDQINDLIKYLKSSDINDLIKKYTRVEYEKIFENCDKKDINKILNFRIGKFGKNETIQTTDNIKKCLEIITENVKILENGGQGVKDIMISELEGILEVLPNIERKTVLKYNENYKSYKIHHTEKYIYGLTNKGYLHVKLYDDVKVRNRNTIGSPFILNKYEQLKQLIIADSYENMYLITNKGKIYNFTSPNQTIFIKNIINLEKDEKPVYILRSNEDTVGLVLLTDSNHVIKIDSKKHLKKLRRNGKILLSDNATLKHVRGYGPDDNVISFLSNDNYLVKYNLSEIKHLSPRSIGVLAGTSESFLDMCIYNDNTHSIAICTEDGLIKVIDPATIKSVRRPARGVKVSSKRGSKNVSLICIDQSVENDNILIYTNLGRILKIDGSKLRTLSRRSVGLTTFDNKVMSNDIILGTTI